MSEAPSWIDTGGGGAAVNGAVAAVADSGPVFFFKRSCVLTASVLHIPMRCTV